MAVGRTLFIPGMLCSRMDESDRKFQISRATAEKWNGSLRTLIHSRRSWLLPLAIGSGRALISNPR